uniref:TIGR02450 family Trp-rich protein n=1 Tax=Cyanothece sp. (strain PCC 7425 / ATCC 29141) TaxID=395961 RepID=B8HT21_CYAP4
MKKQKFPHLLGSKWTAGEETFGWRHFQVVNRKQVGDQLFAELVAACDPQVRFWINARVLLRQRNLWRAGWQSLQEQQQRQIIHPGSASAADSLHPAQPAPAWKRE